MKYWIIINGMQLGPMELSEVASTPGFGPDTPVWREGLPDWTTAAHLPETAALLPQRPAPAPAPAVTYSYAPGGPSPVTDEPMPSTYLVWAILSTICCCIPTGIVALIYASKVSPLYSRGDYAGAKAASEKACWWVIISFVAGLIWAPFSVLWSLLTM